MALRRTFGDVKDPIRRLLGVCATDPRVAEAVNEAIECLVNRGMWVGLRQRYRICTDSAGCITWPRSIETIEAWALCDQPGIIRNQWYEFLQAGPGQLGKDDEAGLTLLDRGEAVTFEDIVGSDKQIKVYADVAEVFDTFITIQGYDENKNWIRTQYAGEWIDGEKVRVDAATPQVSTKIFTSITGVIKPETNGNVRLFSYQASTAALVPLAIYEPDETRPQYRRSQIPNLDAQCCNRTGCDSDTACTQKQITVMAKLRFLPVSKDADWLLISNLAALKMMVKSLMKRDQNLILDAEAYEQKAVYELQKELQSYEGDGAVAVPRVQSRYEWGGGGVENILA